MAIPALQIVFSSFAIISCLMNVVLVVVIVRYRKVNKLLGGSFFSLIILTSSVDIIFAVQFNVLMRARKYRMLDFVLKEGNTFWYIVPRLCCFHYYIKIVHYMCNNLLACNRFTATFYPASYEMVWQSKRMLIVRCLACVLPSCFVLPVVLDFKRVMWLEMGLNNETVRFYRDNSSTEVGYVPCPSIHRITSAD
uniref:Serpentine receptor class gamma n=1 Tax=Steinernema glaseri TaxID=37863 RepID=A0A1I8AA77_9BILA